MVGPSDAFQAHVGSGITTLCRCWAIVRSDGVRHGFTDHDRDLTFDGFVFRADTGLTAMAMQQSTGLSVDNTEALGVLSDASVREADIEAGRFDGAEVQAWMVNWQDTSVRWLQFRGSIGEIRRGGGAFQAELRGLTELLNRPLGRVYQRPCTAVLGDKDCQFQTTQPGFSADLIAEQIEDRRVFSWVALDGFELGWFVHGRLDVRTGPSAGLWGSIKHDRVVDGRRLIELSEPLRASIEPGAQITISAGCDKRMTTCRLKFNNLVNFQGFPDIPSEDWVMSFPKRTDVNTGGSRR